MLLVSGAVAQTDPSSWKRYTVKGEQFSVELPAKPTMESRAIRKDDRERMEITFGSYADGIVYLVHVVENSSPPQSLDSFIQEGAVSRRPVNLKTERKLTVDGVAGKAFAFDGTRGAIQFFSKGDRLYQFTAYGAPQDDARVTKFFSSIDLVDKTDGINVSDVRPPWADPNVTLTSAAPERVFTPQEVDKTFEVVMNSHPEYTEIARQNKVTGTVVLKCTLASDGAIRNIQPVVGLPNGLTEKAIAAARRLKFIPAMKDGKYVSVSTRLVYTFDLY